MRIDRAVELDGLFDSGLTYDDVNIVPTFSDVESRSNIDTRTLLVDGIELHHPLIPANMDSICGLEMAICANNNMSIGFIHRFDEQEKHKDMLESLMAKVNVLPLTIGTNSHDMNMVEFAQKLVYFSTNNGKLVVLIDVAHGHHTKVSKQICRIKDLSKNIKVIAGNVATEDAAYDLCLWGVDGIKVGVGPGSLCTTRLNTGAGVPQFSAIVSARRGIEAFKRDYKFHKTDSNRNPTLIADGGVRYYGDIVKALGAGANCVMSGYLFAGTDKTPGNIIQRDNVYYKQYRGSASRESKFDRGETGNIEGVSMEIPVGPPTDIIFSESLHGIRSGLSYAGFNSIYNMVGNALFCKVSSSSIREAGPHAMRG